MAAQPEPIGLADLVILLYRMDWTRLGMSAGVRRRQDHKLRRQMRNAQAAGRDAQAMGERPPWHWSRYLDRWGSDDGDPPIEEIRGQVLLAPGGRYRTEVTDEEGTRLTVCDGQSQWALSEDLAERTEADGPPFPGVSLLAPAALLTQFDLDLTGTSVVGGRAAHRVVVTPRPVASRVGASFDQATALVDAELGILLSYEEVLGGQQLEFTELTDVRLDPPAAAEQAQFRPPAGLPVQDKESRWDRRYVIPGWPGRVAGLLAAPAAAAVGFAIKHAPTPPLVGATEEAIPARGRRPRPRLEPVADDLVNLLHRTGLPPLTFTAEVHEWSDGAMAMRQAAAQGAALPRAFDGITGPDQMWDALIAQAQGITHRVNRLAMASPGKYRIDQVAGVRPEAPTTIACDGEQLWKVYPNRVAAGPARPIRPELAHLADLAGLLYGWELSVAGEVDVHGRRGFLVAVDGEEGPFGKDRVGWSRWWRTGPFDLVVDAELGIALRQTTYLGDDVAELVELRNVTSHVDPGAFQIEVPAGTRTVGAGPLSDVDTPTPVKVAKVAAGIGAAGVMAGVVGLTGWLQKRPRR